MSATNKSKVCTFFFSPKGCKNGDSCSFSHVKINPKSSEIEPEPPDSNSCTFGDCCTNDFCKKNHPSNEAQLRKLNAKNLTESKKSCKVIQSLKTTVDSLHTSNLGLQNEINFLRNQILLKENKCLKSKLHEKKSPSKS